MSISLRIIVLAIFGLVLPTSGTSFLRRADTQEEVEASLLAELAGTFRPSATKDHITSLENALRPMYNAVPQKHDGTLGHSVVRYVLHRFFAQRGWFMRGLEPAGNSTSGSSEDVLQDLQEWVPTFLQGFLEQLATGRGVSLRELAVLAATLEDLVHKEAIRRLETSYEALELSVNDKLEPDTVREVLEVWMMIYMLGGNFSARGAADVRRLHTVFTKKIDDWVEVQTWMQGIQERMYPSKEALDFDSTGRLVEEIGANYGTYNKKECGSLKSALFDVESTKAGRVTLADFYKKGLTGVFQFNEKTEYLKVLGALDDSDPNEPHVIIPNYVASRPNCLVASGFYAICCTNECEDLMAKLENEVGAEMASPEHVLKIVSKLSTDTLPAPRTLSSMLKSRLQSIADGNDGQVPLHGRLFAQWMHHAFPRECPYPHDGIVNPQTPDEWMQETGQESSVASKEEIMVHVNRETQTLTGAEARKHQHFAQNELPWSESEVLLTPLSAPKTNILDTRRPLRSLLVFAVLFSLASGLAWATKPLLGGSQATKPSKNGLLSFDNAKDVFKMA